MLWYCYYYYYYHYYHHHHHYYYDDDDHGDANAYMRGQGRQYLGLALLAFGTPPVA